MLMPASFPVAVAMATFWNVPSDVTHSAVGSPQSPKNTGHALSAPPPQGKSAVPLLMRHRLPRLNLTALLGLGAVEHPAGENAAKRDTVCTYGGGRPRAPA